MNTPRTFLLILLTLALLLSACAAPAAAPQAFPVADAPAAAEGEISGDLVYWVMWNEGEPEQMVIAETVAEFEKAYPNVNVEVTWAGREVLTKVRSALLAGTQLDLVDHAADELNAALMKNDLTTPLDNLLTEQAYGEDVQFSDVFVPGVLEPYKVDGEVVFIPYQIITSAFWYDENFFSENGLSVPETWDELMQMCETLKGQDKACFAQDGTVDFYNAYFFYWLAERVMGPGAWHNAVSDTTGAAWDDPGWLKVAQMVQEPAEKGYFMPGWDGNIWPAGQVAWSQGDAAAILVGSWVPNETKQTAKPDFKYRGFLFPEVEGGKGKMTEMESYLIGWVIPKDAQNAAAAREFMKFSMQKQFREKSVEEGKNMSARADVPIPDVLPDVKDWFDANTLLFKPYDGVQSDFPSWWISIFLPLDDQLITQQITAEEFIETLKAETVDYWSKPTPTPERDR
ncbi:MAG: extracellular solute-binding protein [Chloroflexota bacterium]|nr:extracellular solute-binding protein [Chloroflexota bacterium]